MSADTEPSVYALLTDGTTVEIRPARPGDRDAVRDLHEKLSPDSLYLRFFSINPRCGRTGSAPGLPRARSGPRRAAGPDGRQADRLRQLRV